MAEINESKLIRDALGSPIPQYWDEESEAYIANTVDGSEVDVDFSKKKLLRDKLGSPIPQQAWDPAAGMFVPGGPSTGVAGVQSINGKTGAISGIAEEKDLQEVSRQLAETPKQFNQMDFVQLLHEHNENEEKMYYRILGNRYFEVAVPLFGNTVVVYEYTKDPADDFIKWNQTRVAKLEDIESVYLKADYDTLTGTGWVTLHTPNHYATKIGDKVEKSFTGTGIDFKHYADNRGGLWEFILDDDETKKVTITTYSATTIQMTSKSLFKGLANGAHKVTGTFKGDDPNNPPRDGAGTSRGWVSFAGTTSAGRETFDIYKVSLSPVFQFGVMPLSSNREFAISGKPVGDTGAGYFYPDHGTGTVFSNSQSVIVDGKIISDWSVTAMTEAKNIKVVQDMRGVHPTDALKVADIYSVSTINKKGVSTYNKFKWARDFTASAGYVNMFPVSLPFAKLLLDSMGGIYDVLYPSISPNTRSWAKNSNEAKSYAFLNNGTGQEKDYVAAMTIKNFHNTMRIGETGKYNPRSAPGQFVWLEHRSETINKLYPQTLDGHVFKGGETYEFGAQYFVGSLPMAANLLT